MTASKSSRARNARRGAQAGPVRNASAARNEAAASGRAAARNGAAGRDGAAARGGAVKNGNGAGARNGATARSGVATNNGAAARGAVTAKADGRPRGRAAAGDDLDTRTSGAGPAVWLQLTTFALALLGLGVSIYLTIAHFTESTLAGCSETKGLVNCTKVTTSAQSYVFGIPVAVLGLAFYVFAVAIMSPWAWRAARREIHLVRIASLVVGIGFVLYLLYAELFIIGSICLYCTSVHVITFLLFVLTMFATAAWGLRPGAAWPQRLTPWNRARQQPAPQVNEL
jgi:uncharacterized membrane protein